MRIAVAVPEAQVTKPVLDAALESVTRLNEQLLEAGSVPTFDKALKAGVKWRPEPPGDENFDHAGTVMRRKWGDCDDIAPYHAASLRHLGIDPDATAVARPSGPNRWHAEVLRGDGTIDDPSRDAGMGRKQAVSGAAVLPMMSELAGNGIDGDLVMRPNFAVRPFYGGWQARTDMPWQGNDFAMSTMQLAPGMRRSLVGSIEGACSLALAGGYADPNHIDRMCAIADHIEGRDLDEIARVYGEEHAAAAEQVVGSFFKKLGKMAKGAMKVATMPLKVASKFAVHIPGVGKIAASTLNLAERAASGDPKALASILKSPIGKSLISMVPGVGPVMSEALQYGLKAASMSPAAANHFASRPDLYPTVTDQEYSQRFA